MSYRNFILLFLAFISCGHNINDYSLGDDMHNYQSGMGITMSYYSHSNIEFQLVASKVKHFHVPHEETVFSDGVKVLVYDKKLDTIAKILADSVIQKKNQDMVEIRKNVILRNIKNEQLHTENLFWDIKEGRVYTEDFVTINTQKEIIMGYGFVTNQKFSNYSIYNITGTIYL